MGVVGSQGGLHHSRRTWFGQWISTTGHGEVWALYSITSRPMDLVLNLVTVSKKPWADGHLSEGVLSARGYKFVVSVFVRLGRF